MASHYSAPAASSMPRSLPALSAATVSSPPPIHTPPMKTRGTDLRRPIRGEHWGHVTSSPPITAHLPPVSCCM